MKRQREEKKMDRVVRERLWKRGKAEMKRREMKEEVRMKERLRKTEGD